MASSEEGCILVSDAVTVTRNVSVVSNQGSKWLEPFLAGTGWRMPSASHGFNSPHRKK
jgi:hypothetical protein